MKTSECAPLAYSPKDACAVLSIGKTKLYALIKERRLRVVRLGGRTLIPVESLHALLNADLDEFLAGLPEYGAESAR